jgi:patatin-like phospholipase/acyl hydrolase
VLALDGGGVKGMVQLEVLAHLLKEIGLGEEVHLSTYFDLMVGSSIGTRSLSLLVCLLVLINADNSQVASAHWVSEQEAGRCKNVGKNSCNSASRFSHPKVDMHDFCHVSQAAGSTY